MRSTAGLALLTVALLAGCRGAVPGPPAPASPAERVLEFFELVRLDEPAAERIDDFFGRVDDEQARAALLDAIEALRPVNEVEIVETYRLDGLGRESFDLLGALPGGGTARYSIQLDTSIEAGRIVWFSGPGVEWPQRRGRGPGLSTSAPPTATTGG